MEGTLWRGLPKCRALLVRYDKNGFNHFVHLVALSAGDNSFQPLGGSVFDKAAFSQRVDGKETGVTGIPACDQAALWG